MYAPKFISWMTDEERFHSALEARIAPMLDAARAECKAMIYLAEASLGLRPTNEQMIFQMKYNQAAGLSSYFAAHEKEIYLRLATLMAQIAITGGCLNDTRTCG